jgi:hypothetical protein
MPLQTGVWHMNVNGVEGDLNIQSVDNNGVVAGMLFGQGIQGFWNEVTQSISFATHVINVNQITPRFYKGFLFSTPFQPQPGQDVLWTLAGFTVDVSGQSDITNVAGNSRRNEFGWFAQVKQIV